ncbi:MAG: (d)CMP kinase [Candidatus Sericytochromatia bacterium]|nr:(d)CMP kinase [Candidatus Sericytochromatia bacterium]
MIIAIDGPAGAGKSSVAKDVAKKLNYTYIDTGAMYRALTWKAIKSNINISDGSQLEKLLKESKIELIPNNEENILKIYLDNNDITEQIRDPLVSNAVSEVSAHKSIRDIMVIKQRNIAQNKNGVVMDGRDIGTVVFPNAEIKIFLTASVEERAKRRFIEQESKGISTDINRLILEISKRDDYDSNRIIAPLKPAHDSIILDTTSLDYGQVVNKFIQIVLDFEKELISEKLSFKK